MCGCTALTGCENCIDYIYIPESFVLVSYEVRSVPQKRAVRALVQMASVSLNAYCVKHNVEMASKLLGIGQQSALQTQDLTSSRKKTVTQRALQ